MKTASLDLLEKSELPLGPARAILTVMEMEMASAQETLATKVDLANLRAEMLERFGTLEGKLTRRVFTCILGQTVVLAALGWFLIAHYHR